MAAKHSWRWRRSTALIGLGLLCVSHVDAAVLSGFQETVVISGLTRPIAVRFAQDGRIFVAEQRGIVRAYDGFGDASPDVVADLSVGVMDNWDRGMLGLAIAPDPPAPGQLDVYVLYSVDAPPGLTPPVWGDACSDQTNLGCSTRGRLSRLRVDAENRMVGGEQVLIDDRWCFQFPSHAIGDLVFGPDGALYLSTGDGASFTFADSGQNANPCRDPMGGAGVADDEGGALRSQDLLTPADRTWYNGALLRLDIRGPTVQPWPDNPLVGTLAPDDDAIVAHGFRNPFRFAIKPQPLPGAGEVWVGDVGWFSFEELNRITDLGAPVENFGWPCYEGGSGVSLRMGAYDAQNLDLCEGLYSGAISSAVVAPFFAYGHASQVFPEDPCPPVGSSVTGVTFYAGGAFPPGFDGALVFQDSSRACIWAFLPGPNGDPAPSRPVTLLWNDPLDPADDHGQLVDLQYRDGDLYFVDYNRGRVSRLRYFAGNQPPVASLIASPTSGPAPLLVALDASESRDADLGDELSFAWDLDGDGQFDDEALADPRLAEGSYTQPGSVVVSLRVSDSEGAASVASVQIVVSNSPPVASIEWPLASDHWRVGEEIAFAGRALDPDDGELSAASLSWRASLHHCETLEDCHAHSLQTFAGMAAGSIVAPDHSYPSFLEIELTATDGGVGGWLDPAWDRRRTLRFDLSAQASDLEDFPLLLQLDASRIDYERTQDAGQDLRFIDPDGTLLEHEVEAWDESATSLVWVRVPRIDGGSTSDFVRMYYGNPDAPDGQSSEATWEASGEVGVVFAAEELSGRLSDAVRVLLAPETREVAFATSPPGLELVVGATTSRTPFSTTFIAGAVTTVSAPSPQPLENVEQRFVGWSDGGAASHSVTATPELASLVATYVSQQCGDGGLDAGEECDDGDLDGGDCCSSLCRAVVADADGDGVCDAGDSCPTVPDPDQRDSDRDGVGQACDTCPLVANPRVSAPAQPWMTLVSGQRDDDGDGLGNACDFDHDQRGPVISASDFNEIKASLGQQVGAASCGTGRASRCAKFDHDESGAAISSADFTLLKAHVASLRAKSCGPACVPPFGGVGKAPCVGPACP